MKKKIILAALACACAAATYAASKAATEAWVKAYVLSTNGGTNGVSVVDGGTNGTYYMTYELYDTYALGVTNSVHATITNGALFAYLDAGVYTNAQLDAFIQATRTNLVWNGIPSHTNALGQTMFGETFGVVGTMTSSRIARKIKGE